ncbi:MAG: superoxide dismutase family protein [Clostridia bacterium]|nr:superoxide dismutase family protein [Clostridia bacterium]
MNRNQAFPNFSGLFRGRPHAFANIRGSNRYPDIQGQVRFYQTLYGVLVVAELMGLPMLNDPCAIPIYAFHIHEGNSCTGNTRDPFANVRSHYNPDSCPHPYHAGDLPPVFNSDGYAFSAFLTDRFSVEEIVGRTVILHAGLDDFTSQPAGNAGVKIACGEIRRR